MAGLVVIFALINICIGYGLAVFLGHVRRAPALPSLAGTLIELDAPLAQPEGEQAADIQPPEEEIPPIEELPNEHDIPQEWIKKLAGQAAPGSFVEASLQVLRLEVAKYRDQLIRIDGDVRKCRDKPDEKVIRSCLDELKTANQNWLAMQAEAAGHLRDKQGNLGDFDQAGADLESVLLEQAAQIETTCTNIELLDFYADIPSGCQRLNTEISRLVDLNHTLRDSMHESLVAIMLHEGALESVDQRMQTDPLTGNFNRTGLECVMRQWVREDPDGRRQVSIAIADLDQLGKINERHGPLIGDQVIREFGRLLEALLRKDRGYDVVCRYAGQRFVAFLGDTGPHNGTSAMERIRQTVSESSFLLDGEEILVTVSCGVVEMQPKETAVELMSRLRTTLAAAKKAGRNQTYLYTEGQPGPVEPPDFSVTPREYCLGFEDG